MRKSKEYSTEVVDQFKYVAWVAAPELWITPYGILSNNGMRDHYGPGGSKEAMKVATKHDHLRYNNNRNASPTIIDELGRRGLNLATHPLMMICLINTSWRFSSPHIAQTFPVHGDEGMFAGLLENMGRDFAKRDGQPYERPTNMFGDTVQLDQ